MKILVIGSNGFIARNLIISLKNIQNISIFKISSKKEHKKLFQILPKMDVVFHLAGINRSSLKKDFFTNNFLLTKKICDFIAKQRLNLKFFYTSTIQVNKSSFYGFSKKKAEVTGQAKGYERQDSALVEPPYTCIDICRHSCVCFFNFVNKFCNRMQRVNQRSRT
jgi:nucleoside-diphosphate-sugar epimerase